MRLPRSGEQLLNSMYYHVGRHPYAAHGGLVVYVNKWDKGPNAFHSTLTIGAVQYVFFSRLTWFERIALQVNHRKFYTWCL